VNNVRNKAEFFCFEADLKGKVLLLWRRQQQQQQQQRCFFLLCEDIFLH